MTQVLNTKEVRITTVTLSDTDVIISADATGEIVVTGAGIKVTADNTPVTAIAGDDITITGSVDGVNFFAVGVAGATLVHELDASIQSPIVGRVTYLKFSPAQILSTETVTLNIITSVG